MNMRNALRAGSVLAVLVAGSCAAPDDGRAHAGPRVNHPIVVGAQLPHAQARQFANRAAREDADKLAAFVRGLSRARQRRDQRRCSARARCSASVIDDVRRAARRSRRAALAHPGRPAQIKPMPMVASRSAISATRAHGALRQLVGGRGRHCGQSADARISAAPCSTISPRRSPIPAISWQPRGWIPPTRRRAMQSLNKYEQGQTTAGAENRGPIGRRFRRRLE